MARSRLCRACGDFHAIEEPWPAACHSHFGTVSGVAPNIIRDAMDPVRSMADGLLYDSKSTYYRSVREAGLEVVGDYRPPRKEYRPPSAREAIKRAMAQHGML